MRLERVGRWHAGPRRRKRDEQRASGGASHGRFLVWIARKNARTALCPISELASSATDAGRRRLSARRQSHSTFGSPPIWRHLRTGTRAGGYVIEAWEYDPHAASTCAPDASATARSVQGRAINPGRGSLGPDAAGPPRLGIAASRNQPGSGIRPRFVDALPSTWE